MLSKPAIVILGLINEKPRNAYEITKMLDVMNIRSWFNIANSTVYATIKKLEKDEKITGVVKKEGNMPDKKIFNLTSRGKKDFLNALKQSIVEFEYDATGFTIAAFFLNALEKKERVRMLNRRLDLLNKYQNGLDKQIKEMEGGGELPSYIANAARCRELVRAEIKGTKIIRQCC